MVNKVVPISTSPSFFFFFKQCFPFSCTKKMFGSENKFFFFFGKNAKMCYFGKKNLVTSLRKLNNHIELELELNFGETFFFFLENCYCYCDQENMTVG